MEDFEIKNEGVIYRMEEKLDIMGMVQVSQHLNKKRNILSFIIVILSLFYLINFIISIAVSEDKNDYLGFIFAFGFSFIIGCILLYKNSKKALKNAIIRLNDDIIDSVISYEFYDDYFISKVNGKETYVEKKIQYSFITYIGKTKNGINYLLTKDRRVLIIQSPEILAFIKAKKLI